MSKHIVNLLALTLAGWATVASAEIRLGYGDPTQTLNRVDSGFGGCMIFMTNLNWTVPNTCPSDYIAFDCAGRNGGSKSNATTAYNTALLALVTGDKLLVYVDDDPAKRIDGYCPVVQLVLDSTIQ